jgi:transposase
MLKYSLGLDVSSKDIHCCLSVIDQVQRVTVKSSRKISNNATGFSDLIQWLEKHYKNREIPLVTTMEATGVYYEHCALFLYQKGYKVSVVLPNKAKKYLQSTGLKSKNDKIDAQGLSRMGAEQALDFWEPLGEYFYQLRTLTRYHQSLQESKTALCNQLHADEKGMYINEQVITMLKSHITMIKEQLKEVEKTIKKHICSDAEVAAKVENICTIKGVGLQTAAVVIAETNGFVLFESTRQLVSYAGTIFITK